MECDTFRVSTGVYEKGHKSSQSEDCNGVMLVSKQLTDTLLDNARIIREESLEIRHKLSQHHVYLSHVEEHTAGRKTVASVNDEGN
jgi:hypothetical protein